MCAENPRFIQSFKKTSKRITKNFQKKKKKKQETSFNLKKQSRKVYKVKTIKCRLIQVKESALPNSLQHNLS